jgi:hypothetical protein
MEIIHIDQQVNYIGAHGTVLGLILAHKQIMAAETCSTCVATAFPGAT